MKSDFMVKTCSHCHTTITALIGMLIEAPTDAYINMAFIASHSPLNDARIHTPMGATFHALTSMHNLILYQTRLHLIESLGLKTCSSSTQPQYATPPG